MTDQTHGAGGATFGEVYARREFLFSVPDDHPDAEAASLEIIAIDERIGSLPATDRGELELKLGLLADPETLACPSLAASIIAGALADVGRLVPPRLTLVG